jgi:predicted transcriptional regulator
MVTISIDDRLARELESLAKDLGTSVEDLTDELLRGTIDAKRAEAKVALGRRDIAEGRPSATRTLMAWLKSWGTDHETEPPR